MVVLKQPFAKRYRVVPAPLLAVLTGIFLNLAFVFFDSPLALSSSRMAVSYTHLDVYKRQGWARKLCSF